VETYCRTGRPQIKIKYSACAFACCIANATNTRAEYLYSLLVYGNICYTNAPEFYVIRTLFFLGLVRVWGGWRYKMF
jgi:hypothetical protein